MFYIVTVPLLGKSIFCTQRRRSIPTRLRIYSIRLERRLGNKQWQQQTDRRGRTGESLWERRTDSL